MKTRLHFLGVYKSNRLLFHYNNLSFLSIEMLFLAFPCKTEYNKEKGGVP